MIGLLSGTVTAAARSLGHQIAFWMTLLMMAVVGIMLAAANSMLQRERGHTSALALELEQLEGEAADLQLRNESLEALVQTLMNELMLAEARRERERGGHSGEVEHVGASDVVWKARSARRRRGRSMRRPPRLETCCPPRDLRFGLTYLLTRR